LEEKNVTQNEESRQEQPPSLSEHYHKARRQVMLWSGILFAWELIGVKVENLAESGGNVGPLFKAIESPQAVPWVLLIMVAYFFYRTVVEWHQSDPWRRKYRVSKIDFSVSLGAGIAAFFLYFLQRVLEIQIADRIATFPISVWVPSFIMGCFLLLSIQYGLKAKREISRIKRESNLGGFHSTPWSLYLLCYGFPLALLSGTILFAAERGTRNVLIPSAIGFAVCFASWQFWRRGILQKTISVAKKTVIQGK
jgi:hypothetical protein